MIAAVAWSPLGVFRLERPTLAERGGFDTHFDQRDELVVDGYPGSPSAEAAQDRPRRTGRCSSCHNDRRGAGRPQLRLRGVRSDQVDLAKGARPFTPNTLYEGELEVQKLRGRSAKAIKECLQQRPRSLHPSANREIDVGALTRMLASGENLRKGFKAPPRSDNAQWDNRTAINTGATDDWNDEMPGEPTVTIIVGHRVGTPDPSNRNAAVDAIKQDLARGAKRMGF